MTALAQTFSGPNRLVLAAALSGLVAVTALATLHGGHTLGLATLIGGLAGVSLYHASFGFTAAWRRIVTEKRGGGLRAQFLLILLTALVSFPLIGWGAGIGLPTGGFVFPFGIAAAIGAFLFGLGMQLGGGCASGTLFTAGGGSTRMMVTLAAFVTGSVAATPHMHLWGQLPKLPAFSLIGNFGPIGAFAITAVVLGAIALWSVRVETRAHGSLAEPRATESVLTGPWSLVFGAVMIAIVGIATFLVLGRPWGITSGFALWGAKIWQGLGVTVTDWPYWQWQKGALEASVFADATSVMNFGILLGAMTAAALAGKYAPVWKLSRRDLLTALIGGLLMGYGARLAYGCNIGAYLGGIVSGSLHGWLWLVFGFIGSLAGTRLRLKLGMG
ncbi:YeeE/YedE family protein [Stappia taiwanensis]|uniref:YeeE/YedE family protein n=1 Tax=Stappia taiwanensis TaxID=992267 RepID=A0A838XS46_9HYPH|nr:YeeE/YedE family protein [Stappia taiwanensis]MBA4612577.1 YeeE/YedE family protein [Stappia taiwanensis]GGE89369.1 membrane protein [Stappia taiwanensis]